MPFLFWWNTWFGRRLPDKQITEYLQDEKRPPPHPARSSFNSVNAWAPQFSSSALVPRISPSRFARRRGSAQHRRLGHGPGHLCVPFHETLLKMLQDLLRWFAATPPFRSSASATLPPSPNRRCSAACQNRNSFAGRISDSDKVGTAVHQAVNRKGPGRPLLVHLRTSCDFLNSLAHQRRIPRANSCSRVARGRWRRGRHRGPQRRTSLGNPTRPLFSSSSRTTSRPSSLSARIPRNLRPHPPASPPHRKSIRERAAAHP